MNISIRRLVLLLRRALLKEFRGGQLTLFALREGEDSAEFTLTEQWNGGKVDGVWLWEVTTWTIAIGRTVAKVPKLTQRD